MSEKELLENLAQIDRLLARCVNPALTRDEHDGIRQVMSLVSQRVRRSYVLEAEKAEIEAAARTIKQEPETEKTT